MQKTKKADEKDAGRKRDAVEWEVRIGMGDGGGCGGLYRSSWISRRNLDLGWSGLVWSCRFESFHGGPLFCHCQPAADSCTLLILRKDSCPPNSRGGIQNEIKIKTACEPLPRHHGQNMSPSTHKTCGRTPRQTHSRVPCFAAPGSAATAPDSPPGPGPRAVKDKSPDAETRSSPTDSLRPSDVTVACVIGYSLKTWLRGQLA